MIRNKKGSILDLFYAVIGIFFIAVVVILCSTVVTRMNTEVQKISLFPTEAKTVGNDLSNTLPNTMNGGILFLFFGMCAASIILASLVIVHPVFFIFYIFETAILIWFSGGIANAFQTFIETPALATEHGQYAIMIWMFQYMPFIIGVIALILAAIMYKVRRDSVYG